MSQVGVYFEVKDRLTAAGVAALDGPADDLPRDAHGLVADCVVMYPSAGEMRESRLGGGASGRDDAVTILCVGHSPLDAANVANAVQTALDGYRLPSGGLLMAGIGGATPPAIEPNADPQRASMPLEYRTVSKG